jgi:hypothetical protein
MLGDAMKRLVTLVDVATGRTVERPRDTQTLDLPVGYEPGTSVVSLDAQQRGHHLTQGRSLTFEAVLRPLSWRVHGEHCLVARTRTEHGETAFRLCIVEPARVEPPR